MRAALPLVVVLLLAPSAFAAVTERDRPAEVLGGAPVFIHLAYEGRAVGSRSGSETPYALTESNSLHVEWSGEARLRPSGVPGELAGQIVGEWRAGASSQRAWDYRTESSSLDEDSSCEASGVKGPVLQEVVGTLVGDGLQLRLTGYAVPGMVVEGACRWTRVETTLGETTSTSGTRPLERNVPLHHFFGAGKHYETDVGILVPLDGRASLPASHSSAVPTGGGSLGNLYCVMSDTFDWAPGSCDASGTLTVRSFVEPCAYIRQTYAERYEDLAGVPPLAKGSSEETIRAWAASAQPKVGAILEAARAWQLVGCEGELAPDPWDPIVRVMQMQRDALLDLARESKLTKEGISEAIGAERGLQLIGVDTGTGAEALLTAIAHASGQIAVAVHSPVSLHAWSQEGGHVGWNATTNRSEATIPGASYDGAPGGAQRIVLPAGFYRIEVDELAAGRYLLEVETNGTGADAQEAFLVPSAAGRTTSTHYASTTGWDGPRLDAFPVRRAATTDASAFFDEGRPSMGTPGSGGSAVAAGPDPAETPLPSAMWALLVVLVIAFASARRRR